MNKGLSLKKIVAILAILILFISIGIFIYFENFELKNNDIKISNNYKYTIEIPGKKLSKFSYSSDNLNVCEVDKNGNITSLSNGEAIITVTSKYGLFKKKLHVVVGEFNVLEIAFKDKFSSVKVGDVKKLDVLVNNETGYVGFIKFVSSDNSICVVDNDGYITGVGVGEVNIIAYNSSGEVIDSSIVTVYEKEVNPKSISITDSEVVINENESYLLNATIYPVNATNKSIEWNSSNTDVCVVDDNGRVTAYSSGKTIITASVKGTKIKAECIVYVLEVNDLVYVSNISFNNSNLNIAVGQSEQLTYSVLPSNASDKNVIFSSSNPLVVSVDSNGVIYGLSSGSAVITIKSNSSDVSSTCNVVVNDKKEEVVKVSSVKLNKNNLELLVGKSESLSYTISPTNATNKNITWGSSNTKVATVDNGKVVAISEGKANISITTSDGYKVDNCEVVVKKNNTNILVEDIKLSSNSLKMTIGDSNQLSAIITPSYATNKTVTYSSSNTKAVTVDANGLVKAIGVGDAVIKASIDGKVSECSVSVVSKSQEVKTITVYFHRNLTASDSTCVYQKFTLGEAGNKFGYNTDGTPRTVQTGQFGKWDKIGYDLLGWALPGNMTTKVYSPYANVSSTFINQVYNKELSGQETSKVIHLYAVWSPRKIVVYYHRNLNDTDTAISSQKFTYGEDGNRFGYKNDGTPRTEQTGQFGHWDKAGNTLLGWALPNNLNSKSYAVYYNVSDTFINQVYNKELPGQAVAKEIHLYAVWSPWQIKLNFYRNLDSNDTTKLSQTIIYGASNNKFASGIDFSSWDNNKKECITGWALKEDREKNTQKYNFDNGVSNSWIAKIYAGEFAAQNKAGELDLYGVWSRPSVLKDANGNDYINCMGINYNYLSSLHEAPGYNFLEDPFTFTSSNSLGTYTFNNPIELNGSLNSGGYYTPQGMVYVKVNNKIYLISSKIKNNDESPYIYIHLYDGKTFTFKAEAKPQSLGHVNAIAAERTSGDTKRIWIADGSKIFEVKNIDKWVTNVINKYKNSPVEEPMEVVEHITKVNGVDKAVASYLTYYNGKLYGINYTYKYTIDSRVFTISVNGSDKNVRFGSKKANTRSNETAYYLNEIDLNTYNVTNSKKIVLNADAPGTPSGFAINNGKAYLLTGYHVFNTKDSTTNKSYNSVLRIFNVDSSVNLSYAGYKGIVASGSSVNLQNIEVEGLDIIDNKLLVYTSDSTDTKNQKRGVIHVFPI